VRCWTPTGREIQLCGHGLLCCGHYWLDRWQTDTILEMGGVEVPVEYQDGIDWASFPALETRDMGTPAWMAELLGQAPERAAEAGPADGYLVVEMAPDCDIAALPRPGAKLTCHSQRSLIVTREVPAAASLCGETVQYRYFAPQHGVPEDTATGSAMRVLASYWQSRGAGDQLQALQRSADGGWLLSRLDQDRTWIGGHVVEDRGAAA
jgi:predicted PhzF superfamily epimerase YddE/YHI9